MFETEFIFALLAIIAIDIVLGGDNAVVIAMASRKLPQEQKKKAVLWGTGLAVLVRVLATLAAAFLLQIPYLFFVGGLVLTWIAYKLLAEDDNGADIKASDKLLPAIQTIVVADIMMGLDNVLAVAGAAKGDELLVILGLLISIPIMIFGSHLILKLMERYTWIPFFGAAILAYAAANMITHEKAFASFFEVYTWLVLPIKIAVIVAVVGLGYLKQKQNDKNVSVEENESESVA